MFHLANYSGVIQECFGGIDDGQRLIPLAPKGPLQHVGLETLRQTSDEDLMGGEVVEAPEFVDCVRSAAFLYFSALDESHQPRYNIAPTQESPIVLSDTDEVGLVRLDHAWEVHPDTASLERPA